MSGNVQPGEINLGQEALEELHTVNNKPIQALGNITNLDLNVI